MHISKICSNFAAKITTDMKNRLLFILLLSLSFVCAHAETIVLRTGARVKGTIVFQNEEVVIIRNAEGARFQYPRADVQEIREDEEEVVEEQVVVEEEQDIKTSKKASILLELSAGSAYVVGESLGAQANADLLVGSHHIGNRHIFVGAGVGYHGLFMVNPKTTTGKAMQVYNFLPIQAAVRMPFLETKHSPVFGVALGYGVALSKDYLGGLYAGLDLGYRCQINPKSAIGVVVYANFQQAKIKAVETVETDTYINYTGRNLVGFGAKFSLYF